MLENRDRGLEEPKPRKKCSSSVSDMREGTPELDLESAWTVEPFGTFVKQRSTIPDLGGIQVYVLGADGAGESISYWQAYFHRTKANLREFSPLRNCRRELARR